MDIEKELQQLKLRISLLETLKNILFGSSYSSTGSSSSDYLIKTKGKIKIQIGNKFIDLLKDGKLNVDSKFIFKGKEVGSKDGIYITGEGEDSKVVISVGGSKVDLKGEVGTTYVSFLNALKTTPELKYTALKNIGFIYLDISEALIDSLKSGIIYVESEQKLYIIQNGKLLEFTAKFPNPYPKLFIISKSDKDNGALIIKGSGIENSIAFDSLSLYSSKGNTYIDSSGEVYIKVGDEDKIIIGESKVVFSNKVISLIFQSEGATESSGFKLYVNLDGSNLEVDNLVVRNGLNSSNNYLNLYPKYWYLENNLISSVPETKDLNKFSLNLVFQNKFLIGDSLYTFVPIKQDTDLSTNLILLPLKVESLNVDTSNTIYVSLLLDIMNEEDIEKLSFYELLSALKFLTIFLAGRVEPISLLRRDLYNIDLLTSTGFTDELNIKKVLTRIGNIEELNLSGKENSKEVPIKGVGIYSNNANFLKAQYTSLYSLPPKDSSSKFASTEWVNKLISSLNLTPSEGGNQSLPVGSIIMFNGLSSEIPDGWHICDGTEGTPNLIGKFIKASSVPGQIGGQSSILILEENMPEHTHTFTNNEVVTSSAGAHTHTIKGKYGKSSSANDINCLEVEPTSDLIITSLSGAHTHTIDMSNTQLSHLGGGKPILFEPLYYSLIYIMKIG